jgi:hypothetical protein
MKQISENLRNRLKTELASAELVLELLKISRIEIRKCKQFKFNITWDVLVLFAKNQVKEWNQLRLMERLFTYF